MGKKKSKEFNQSKFEKSPKRILLAGNGINRAQDISWGKMLNYVQKKCVLDKGKIIDALNTKVSPSFIFEYICQNTMGGETEVRNQIKEYVFDKSNFVNKLWNIYDIVLTTNFDSNLVISNGNKEKLKNNEFLKRRFDFQLDNKQKKIFYIHGYYLNPDSICLGFNQYVENLKLIKDFVQKYYPVKKEFWENHASDYWPDFFFSENTTIDILGFNLSSDEIDLWYILNYRKQVLEKIKNNKINYFDLSSKSFTNNATREKELKDKKQMMESLGITVCEILETVDYDSDFYSLC